MKRINILYGSLAFVLLLGYSCSFIYGSGDDDLADAPMPTSENGWVYGKIDYEHDLLSPNLYFMELALHPKAKYDKAIDGYMSKDGRAVVLLRGVDTPRALHDVSERHRPHLWRERERQRWDEAMRYVWNLTDPTHTFRVHNMRLVKVDIPMQDITHAIEADLEFFLGGQWHNLAVAMLQDEHARPVGDGSVWDAGSNEFSLENPNNPK